MAGNGFRLKVAEFRGQVIESLISIKEDIKEIKLKNTEQHKQFFNRIQKLERRPSLSGLLIDGLLTFLGRK